MQPLRKCAPRIASCGVDGSPAGIAEAHECEVEVQRPDENVGKPGGDSRWISTDPRCRDRRKRHEVPEGPSQAANLGLGIHEPQCAARPLRRAAPRSRSSRRNWSGGTKKGFVCRIPPMMTTGCVRKMSMVAVAPNLVRS